MSKEIIEMVNQAGWTGVFNTWNGPSSIHTLIVPATIEQIKEFVKVVEKRKCEELAKKIEAMPFGTTGESFAVWIREQA